MKAKQILTILTLLSAALFSAYGQNWITCTNSGIWEDPTIWDSGTVPGTNDFAEIDSGFTVTVATNAIVNWIINASSVPGAGGTLIMGTNATLEVINSGVSGTAQLGVLDASAPGNTVIYDNNPFYAKHCNYYNLVFNAGTNAGPFDFFNGLVGPGNPAVAMTVAGNMVVIGKTKVQQGDDFTINGNLLLDTNASWDCSSFNLNVAGSTTLGAGAVMVDLDGANGTNFFGGGMTVSSTALGWNLTDVTTWYLGGSLTNNGTIVGKPTGWASIFFNGTGIITGSQPIKIPTMTINGTYFIADTITLTTNNANFNGTLIFDLARTNQIILRYAPTTNALNTTLTNYYGGNLIITNSGPAPASGNSYKFFSASNYAGTFTSTTYPPLAPGLSWVDNSLISGSYAVTGTVLGHPTLTITRSGVTLTLTWDSTTYPGYSVLAQTNSAGVNPSPSSWFPTGSGTTSPYPTTINPAGPPVFYRLSHP